MPSPTRFTVATANTYFGKTIRDPSGLHPLKPADVLLLQEVFNPQSDSLEETLRTHGFTLLHSAPHFGLIIAIRTSSKLQLVPRSAKEHTLGTMTKLEHHVVQKATRHTFSSTKRGLITCEFILPNKQHVIIGTTHPTTPVSTRLNARIRQIKQLQRILLDNYTVTPPILGGDMNHYPTPRKVDARLYAATALTPVDLQNEPTWRAQGSKQEKILRLPARLLRRPLDTFDGQHDTILYNAASFTPVATAVVDIPSDHRAILTTFTM